MRKLIISLTALITIQSIFATDRLSSLPCPILGKYDYLLAGSGVVIDFKTPTEKQQEQQKKLGEDGFAEAGGNNSKLKAQSSMFKGSRLGLLSVDEVEIDSAGTMQYLRRHNGDQTHQGRHARIGVGEWKILHIKLYEY